MRAHFVKRVGIIGSESSGTTTLARASPSIIRRCGYQSSGASTRKGGSTRTRRGEPTSSRSSPSSRRGWKDVLARVANKVLICDTDPFATAIWHERYSGSASNAVREIADQRRYALYVVTDVAISFVQDGIRDGESFRNWMQGRFVDELSKKSAPMLPVSGAHEERLANAVRRIDELFW